MVRNFEISPPPAATETGFGELSPALRPYKLPPTLICGFATIISAGELAAGTDPLFVSMVAAALVLIGITYNLLGGIGTLSGLLFTCFALRTLVISQIGKVVLFEAADKNLEAPLITISLYALFYAVVAAAVFLYGRTRLALPKPLEPLTPSHARVLYVISLAVGGIATAVFDFYSLDSSNPDLNNAHSAGLAFSGLLLFSIVVAVDSRIRATGGEHSWSWRATIPTVLTWVSAFLFTSRGGFALPVVVYFATCYMRGFRFRKRHFLMGGAIAVFFLAVLSPFELYSRNALVDLNVEEKVRQAFFLVAHPPSRSDILAVEQQDQDADGGRGEYFTEHGTMVLNRFSLIRPDSDLISSCASGFHYGFASIKIDLLNNVPRFLYPQKPDTNSGGYVGRVAGVNPDTVENSYASFSPIAESFGGFGALGVVVFAFFMFPVLFVIAESVFDVSRPWGTVAMGMLIQNFGEHSVGNYLVIAIKTPLYLILLSWLVGLVARLIPTTGDRRISRSRTRAVSAAPPNAAPSVSEAVL